MLFVGACTSRAASMSTGVSSTSQAQSNHHHLLLGVSFRDAHALEVGDALAGRRGAVVPPADTHAEHADATASFDGERAGGLAGAVARCSRCWGGYGEAGRDHEDESGRDLHLLGGSGAKCGMYVNLGGVEGPRVDWLVGWML